MTDRTWIGEAAFYAVLTLCLWMGGCGAPGYIKAEAIEGTLHRVIERHDHYTDRDIGLAPLERRANLRDTELLMKLLEEAQAPTEEEE